MFNKPIPNFKPYTAKNQLKYVTDCIKSGWLGAGKYHKLVEDKVKNIFGVKYVILVNSGTAACKLALIGCGIGKNDIVLSPTFTYIATNNAILSVGAKPYFIDSDRLIWNVDTEKIREKITDGRLKGILSVNLLGQSADYSKFIIEARKKGIKVIEDNCQAIFAKYYSKYTGTIGDAAAFSFFSNKIISAGEGGMVIFKKKEDYERALLYKNQGRDYKKGRYYHSQYGENMNLTNLQAAIILAQLEDRKYILQERNKIEFWYQEEFKNNPAIEVRYNKFGQSVLWFFAVLVTDRDTYVKYMQKNGVEVIPVWKPNHQMPHLKNYVFGEYPNAEYISKHGVMLPTYVGMTKRQVKRICELTKRFYGK